MITAQLTSFHFSRIDNEPRHVRFDGKRQLGERKRDRECAFAGRASALFTEKRSFCMRQSRKAASFDNILMLHSMSVSPAAKRTQQQKRENCAARVEEILVFLAFPPRTRETYVSETEKKKNVSSCFFEKGT